MFHFNMPGNGLVADGLAIPTWIGTTMQHTGFLINYNALGAAKVQVEIFLDQYLVTHFP
jgi:hypothetical protein